MPKSIGVVPAYGRDYKSKKEIQADIDAGKDFTISDMSSKYDGRYANKESFLSDGITEIKVRYSKLRKVAIFKLS